MCCIVTAGVVDCSRCSPSSITTERYTKLVELFTQRRSEERWMFSAASVCWFVCQHDNFRTSKHRMMNLRG